MMTTFAVMEKRMINSKILEKPDGFSHRYMINIDNLGPITRCNNHKLELWSFQKEEVIAKLEQLIEEVRKIKND